MIKLPDWVDDVKCNFLVITSPSRNMQEDDYFVAS